VEQAQHTRAQLAHCDARLAEVVAALQAAKQERDAAKRDAITAAAGAPHKTVSEMQVSGEARRKCCCPFPAGYAGRMPTSPMCNRVAWLWEQASLIQRVPVGLLREPLA